MSLGGNKNLHEFLKDYDLNDETELIKYNTKAAEYYRKMLYLHMNMQTTFNEAPPNYEEGRKPEDVTESFNMFGALGHVASSVKDLGSTAISGAS